MRAHTETQTRTHTYTKAQTSVLDVLDWRKIKIRIILDIFEPLVSFGRLVVDFPPTAADWQAWQMPEPCKVEELAKKYKIGDAKC